MYICVSSLVIFKCIIMCMMIMICTCVLKYVYICAYIDLLYVYVSYAYIKYVNMRVYLFVCVLVDI